MQVWDETGRAVLQVKEAKHDSVQQHWGSSALCCTSITLLPMFPTLHVYTLHTVDTHLHVAVIRIKF